jgi:hypothetical protein
VIRDRFGYLPCDSSFNFSGGSILPLQEIYKIKTAVENRVNEDGFLYPPLSCQVKLEPRTNKILGKIPKTKRPPLLHPVWASHDLSLSDAITQEKLRKGPGAFVIHLMAYLFGIRLQFHDWWFDSRVPTRLWQTHNTYVSPAIAEDFLSHCYRTWQSWNSEEQKRITNVLSMHSRAPSYEWDWERFTIEYMVLDGCWKLARPRFKLKNGGHSRRIEILCNSFGIPFDKVRAERIVALRNDLFHETLWDGSQPCTAVSAETFLQPLNLRRLNQRLIPALLGYNNCYVQSVWWSRGTRLFDKL